MTTGIGALATLSAATVTVAFQTLLDVLGIGVTVIVFVILGNPSAGGAYQAALLPPFFRAIGIALPNGAGTHALRRIVYFGGHGVHTELMVLAAGTALTSLASRLRVRGESVAAPPRVATPVREPVVNWPGLARAR